MAQLPLPVGRQEFHDGNNWFSLASENWVLNNIANIPPCLVATTVNLTAIYANGTSGVAATLTNSGTQAALTIDGVALAVGNRVLVKDQATALQNGIYTVTNIGSSTTNWVLTRATDFDSPSQMVRGNVIEVISGTINSVTTWMLTSIVTAVGTDSLTFPKLSQNGISNVLGTTNQITVTVNNNIATISIANNPVFTGNGSMTIPNGTTAQRPSTPTVGMMRLNTSL
jgi:hypothetical protein